MYECVQNQIETTTRTNRSAQSKKPKQNHDQMIEILPYENTYGALYYPDQWISIDKVTLEKIMRGVQAMAMALTNTVNEHYLENTRSSVVM